MAFYAGETITFATSAVNIDTANTPLTNSDVNSTEITIVDSEGTEVLAPTPMVWNATDSEWRYAWTAPSSGKFTARLRLIGANFDTWEFKAVNIRPNVSPFTIP